MVFVRITCPACGYGKDVDRESIPDGTIRAACPRCGHRFPFDADNRGARQEDDAAGARPEQRSIPFRFTGQASEYFGIWVVNILLRLVTVGLYSPWAKVRKRRYFYGNTLLDDSPFEYLASPWAILKGWLIAAGLFGLSSVLSRLSPILGPLVMLCFFALMPWLVVRSLRFNLRNTSYRNIRTGFRPAYREAYIVFAGLPLLVPLTLGLIAPYMLYRQKRFLVENASYGTTPLQFHASARDYYILFLRAAGWFLLCVGAFWGVVWLVAPAAGTMQATGLPAVLPFLSIPVFIGTYLFFGVYVQTRLANLTYNAITVGSGRLRCDLRTRDMFWLYLSSGAAILCSVGLLVPWAAIRLARYRLGRMSFETADSLDRFIAGAQYEIGAAGEEISDFFDFDVSL